MPAFINRALLPLFDAVNKRRKDKQSGELLIPRLGDAQIEDLRALPPVACDELVVLGTGALTGPTGRRVAEMVKHSILAHEETLQIRSGELSPEWARTWKRGGLILKPGGTIVFTGGAIPFVEDRKIGLKMIEQASKERKITPTETVPGIIKPWDGEPEGHYGARAFGSDAVRLGIEPSFCNVIYETASTNMQQNIQAARQNGSFKPATTVGIVGLPQEVLRGFATVRQETGGYWKVEYASGAKRDLANDSAPEASQVIALRGLHAWPKEIGITRQNYLDDPRARRFMHVEYKKYNPLDPEQSPYVLGVDGKKPFCIPVDLDREATKSMNVLLRQDPELANIWYHQQVRARKLPVPKNLPRIG
jgi:hypothetical protein